jgi:ATP-binding cassette subfamily C (CFTR/MRP) protein 1
MQSDRSLAQQQEQQQHIFATGSFSGFQRLGELGHGYLTQSRTGHQPFCGNEEGWGPLSPYRYDLTPCALDVVVSSVALYGILFGAAAVWYLVKRRKAQEVKRDLHFWTKQVCVL